MSEWTVPAAVRDALADDDRPVRTALDLLAYDTQNPPGSTRTVVDYVEDRLGGFGVEARRIASDPEKPNLLARLPGAGDATFLLNGHLDTVPFDAAEWEHDPLGERVGDRVYGRGATDMKGAVASMLAALRAHAETGTEPPVDLVLALVSDEETAGEAGLSALLERHDCHADACVIGEPTCRRDRHSVTVADRGSIWLTLVATGVAAHGSRPALGVNAIDRLYAAVSVVRDSLADYPLDVDPELGAILDESVAFYAGQMDEATAREMFSHPTTNLGVLRGGSAINAVPDHATARLDVRLTASVETPDVLADVEAVVDDHDGVEITDVSWSRGTYEDPDGPVVGATVETAEDVLGERVYRRSATGGGDAKQLRRAGIATVEFAAGTDTAHAVDEYTTVRAILANADVYARLPYAYASRHAASGTD